MYSHCASSIAFTHRLHVHSVQVYCRPANWQLEDSETAQRPTVLPSAVLKHKAEQWTQGALSLAGKVETGTHRTKNVILLYSVLPYFMVVPMLTAVFIYQAEDSLQRVDMPPPPRNHAVHVKIMKHFVLCPPKSPFFLLFSASWSITTPGNFWQMS